MLVCVLYLHIFTPSFKLLLPANVEKTFLPIIYGFQALLTTPSASTISMEWRVICEHSGETWVPFTRQDADSITFLCFACFQSGTALLWTNEEVKAKTSFFDNCHRHFLCCTLLTGFALECLVCLKSPIQQIWTPYIICREIEPQEGHPVLSVSWSPSGDQFMVVTGSCKVRRHQHVVFDCLKFAPFN